jgi:hypothetical protein
MESEMILILVMISFALVFLSGYAAGYFRADDRATRVPIREEDVNNE